MLAAKEHIDPKMIHVVYGSPIFNIVEVRVYYNICIGTA